VSDTLTGIAAVEVFGNADTVIGGLGSNTLIASGSNETLIGGSEPSKNTVIAGVVSIDGTNTTDMMMRNTATGALETR